MQFLKLVFNNGSEDGIEHLKQPVCFILAKYLLMTDHIVLRISLPTLDQSQVQTVHQFRESRRASFMAVHRVLSS